MSRKVETHPAGQTGAYVTNVNFDTAATWGVEVSGTVNGQAIDPVRLVPILHYDGTPITARFIAKSIDDHLDALKVKPMKVTS